MRPRGPAQADPVGGTAVEHTGPEAGWLEDPEAMADALARTGMAAAVIDLATTRVTAASVAAATLLGGEPREVTGRPIVDFLADEPTGAVPLLATGRLDGFEAPRRLRRLDGSTLDAYVWVHVLGDRRPARSAVVSIATEAAPLPYLPHAGTDTKVIGTVDAEWRVDRISREVEDLLGYGPGDLAGAGVLSAVHPSDLANLLTGMAHMHETGRDALVRVRLRRADGGWVWCRVHLAALGGSAGFAFTVRPVVIPTPATAERVRELELRLSRIAQEITGARLGAPTAATPVMTTVPEMAALTSREWEVLGALLDGYRPPDIARRLGVSASTVRNHLTAIFRKFGVTSQTELLQHLRARSGPPAPGVSGPVSDRA
jgi:PAS domain S-box-containing protein